MGKGKREEYRIVQDILVAGVVVDVDGHAAESGDFGGEFGEELVVLPACVETILADGVRWGKFWDIVGGQTRCAA